MPVPPPPVKKPPAPPPPTGQSSKPVESQEKPVDGSGTNPPEVRRTTDTDTTKITIEEPSKAKPYVVDYSVDIDGNNSELESSLNRTTTNIILVQNTDSTNTIDNSEKGGKESVGQNGTEPPSSNSPHDTHMESQQNTRNETISKGQTLRVPQSREKTETTGKISESSA